VQRRLPAWHPAHLGGIFLHLTAPPADGGTRRDVHDGGHPKPRPHARPWNIEC